MTDTVQLFHRHGEVYKGTYSKFDAAKGSAEYRYLPKCGRCGGAGGSDKWAHTGWTCFQCHGSGNAHDIKVAKIYTAEKLAKLNATASKKAIAKAARAKAKADAARVVALATRRVELAPFEDQLRAFWPLRNVSKAGHSILRSILYKGRVSEKQLAALENIAAGHAKKVAEQARRQASVHLGQPGERLVVELKLVKAMTFDSAYGPFTIKLLRDQSGNSYKTTGRLPDSFYDVVRDSYGDNVWKPVDAFFKVKATVKAHEIYKDEAQTVLTRLNIVEA